MIKWIGYFRDELYNTLHKVEITHSYEQDKPRTITPIDGQAKVGRGIYRGISLRADSSTPTFPFKTVIKDAIYNDRFGFWQVDLDAWVEDEYTFEGVNMSFSYECYPEERKLMLAGESPVVINYEGEDNNIYKPCKYSSSTLKLITDWYDDDLYSKSIFDNKVTISYMTDEDQEEYTILWEGYVTPNAYNQGFAYDIEDLQIECIDSLSALQYKEYEEGTQSVVSAGDILSNTLKDFDHLYIQDNNYIGDVEDNEEKKFDGYTSIDYLMTDGKAFIDTNYFPTNRTRVETDCFVNYENISAAGRGASIFGCESDGKATMYVTVNDYDYVHNIGFVEATYCIGETSAGIGLSFATKRHLELYHSEVKDTYNGYARLDIDNTSTEFWCANRLERSDKSLYLFGYSSFWGDAAVGVTAGVGLGHTRVLEKNEFNEYSLMLDLYPVKRNSDGMLGMYDTISKRFFTNANTIGAFVQGSPEGEGSDKTLSELKFTNPLDITKLQLSEYPFYNEDEEEYEKSNTLIEEICKFLGYTAVAKGRELWLLDYSNIKAPLVYM